MIAGLTVVLVAFGAIAAVLAFLLGKAHQNLSDALDGADGARMALGTVSQSLKWARHERAAAQAELVRLRASEAPKSQDPVGRPYGHLRCIDGGRPN